MSETGIWSPSCGIHGLADALAEAFKARRGEIRLATPAAGILTKGGRVAGVTTAAGEVLGSRWVVSTADYKTTFLDLLPPGDVPREHLDLVRKVPYTGSELCVYLGVDTGRVDLSRMRADHLFYRREVRAGGRSIPGTSRTGRWRSAFGPRTRRVSSRPAGRPSFSGRLSHTILSPPGEPARS